MNYTNMVLDEEQKKAVYAPADHSFIILAPPGCGKTLIMAKRIEFLINMGVIRTPFRALGLTFSNAAASEMKERIRIATPDSAERVHITNFHSFGYTLLRAYGNLLGMSRNFKVMDELDRRDLLLTIFAKHEKGFEPYLRMPPVEVAATLQNDEVWKAYETWILERILRSHEYLDRSHQDLFEHVYKAFLETTSARNLVDFDHLLQSAYYLLRSHPKVLDYYRAGFKYILVDEFQDTNALQFKLLSLFASNQESASTFPKARVFILADPEQGIYEFQGASSENIEIAKTAFGCSIIELQKDHRNDAGSIKTLKDAIRSVLRSGKTPENVPEHERELCKTYSFEDYLTEASFVTDRIVELVASGVELHNIAVIAPSRFRLDAIKLSFQDREIRFLFLPDFQGNIVSQSHKSLLTRLENKTKGAPRKPLRELFIDACQEENIDVIANDIAKILLRLCMNYDHPKYKGKSSWEKFQTFTNETLLEINWGQVLRREVKNKVFLSTIHGVKGLEFDSVFLCGLERFALPNYRICFPCNNSWHITDKLREDWIRAAKTFYVGVSRAKTSLQITSSLVNNRGTPTQISCLVDPFRGFIVIDNPDLVCPNAPKFRA